MAQTTINSPSTTSQPARFERITPADGLSFPIIRDILQDEQGFMWFATDSGLNKYDGYQFTVYKEDLGDTTSIRFDEVRVVYQDSDGVFWVGGGGGLDKFDPTAESFTHVDTRGQVFCIYEDSAGTLWVGFWHGLYGYDRATGVVTHSYQRASNPEDDSKIPADDAIATIQEDKSGDLWLGTPSGLDRLNLATGTFTHYRHDPNDPHSLSHNAVSVIFEDTLDNLWIGTAGGLNLLDRSAGIFERYQHDPDDARSLANNQVISILEDSAGLLWIGTLGGLDRLDPQDLATKEELDRRPQFTHIRHNPVDPYSLSDDVVLTLYEDRSGVLWVGTANGISKYNRRTSLFTHGPGFSHVAAGTIPESNLSDNKVAALYADQDYLWIGTFGAGLSRLNLQTGEFTSFRHDPTNPDTLSSETVQAIFRDGDSNLWVGTGSGWLDQYQPNSETFVHIRNLVSPVLDIAEDQSGHLWIGTEGGGLYQFDGDTGTWTHHEQFWTDPDHWWWYGSLSSHIVSAILVDHQGVPWAGTRYGGINLWDRAEERFNHFRHDPDDPNSLSHETVFSIFEDVDLFPGAVWIGTGGGGLNRFDRSSGDFTHFSEADGLPGDSVSCIVADDAGNLWLGTVNGVVKFDPRTQSFTHYGQQDGVGVYGSGFAPTSCVKAHSGELFFGGLGGMLSFRPEQIVDNQHAPPVVITTLNLFDRTLQQNLPAGEHVKLAFSDNFISFEFTALDYTVPEKNQYAYMLEGLDEDWVQAGTRRYANYPDLRPGDYLFRVKGSNNDGVWNEEGTWVRITVEPPFWDTWPFRVLVVVSFVLAGLTVYRQRVRRVEAQSRELEDQVKERTAELVQTNVLLEQEISERQRAEEALAQKAAEEAVTAERGRLARELHDAVTQTLFSASLIAEALPQLWEMDQTEGRELLSKLRQLSRGALSEMRALLLELRPAALLDTDLADLLRQLADAAAGRSGVSVKLSTEGAGDLPAELHIALYRIAQEALNNVVKHARAGRVDISLSRLGEESDRVEWVELSIGDDGCGFDPDRVAADHLGVSIMHERAAAIGATLEIESEIDRGTIVRVVWPAEKAAVGASDE